ncbi:alpha/beta hydrolase [Candidatus Harpocratesius sp.]
MQKEELDIIVREEKLHGILYIPENHHHPNGSNLLFPLIIHINGMPGTSPEDDEDRFAKKFTEHGIAYYCYDHQGVRQSSGVFTYFSAQANIEYVVDYLVHHRFIDPLQIGLLGESFGGAMALCHSARDYRISVLALRSPVSDTEIVTTYSFFDDLLKIWTRNKQMRFPPDKNMKNLYISQTHHYNPKNMADSINQPVKIIAGKRDELLGDKGFEDLFKKLNSTQKEIEIYPKANHNFTNAKDFEKMRDSFIEFFSKQFNGNSE